MFAASLSLTGTENASLQGLAYVKVQNYEGKWVNSASKWVGKNLDTLSNVLPGHLLALLTSFRSQSWKLACMKLWWPTIPSLIARTTLWTFPKRPRAALVLEPRWLILLFCNGATVCMSVQIPLCVLFCLDSMARYSHGPWCSNQWYGVQSFICWLNHAS